jgi:CHAD domain-containing protein
METTQPKDVNNYIAESFLSAYTHLLVLKAAQIIVKKKETPEGLGDILDMDYEIDEVLKYFYTAEFKEKVFEPNIELVQTTLSTFVRAFLNEFAPEEGVEKISINDKPEKTIQ